MSAHTFDRHSVTCPICHQTGRLQPGQAILGLYTCPHCQARLVVSWSGNYVRDPFALRKLAVSRMLRRQSHPWARILRDFSFLPIAAIAAATVMGLTLTSVNEQKSPSPIFQHWIEDASQLVD